MKPVKKAILPVAGLGTRFLPATKAIPKEMLPIIDKPLVQYAVEEAIDIGVTEIIFITSHAKKSIENIELAKTQSKNSVVIEKKPAKRWGEKKYQPRDNNFNKPKPTSNISSQKTTPNKNFDILIYMMNQFTLFLS